MRRPRRFDTVTGTTAILLIAVLVALASAAPAVAGVPGWPWPVDGDVLTGFKNGSDPYAAGQHRGIDIDAEVGAPVSAPAAGTVSFAGTLPDGGIAVTVRTPGGMLLSHLHLSAAAVSRGASVSAGDRIGSVGTTGDRSHAAPHLHFSVRDAAGTYLDPLRLLAERVPTGPTDAPQASAVAVEPHAGASLPDVRQPAHGHARPLGRERGISERDRVRTERAASSHEPSKRSAGRPRTVATGGTTARTHLRYRSATGRSRTSGQSPQLGTAPRIDSRPARGKASDYASRSLRRPRPRPEREIAAATRTAGTGGSPTQRLLLALTALALIALLIARRRPRVPIRPTASPAPAADAVSGDGEPRPAEAAGARPPQRLRAVG